MGVSFVNICEKSDRVIRAPHCAPYSYDEDDADDVASKQHLYKSRSFTQRDHHVCRLNG